MDDGAIKPPKRRSRLRLWAIIIINSAMLAFAAWLTGFVIDSRNHENKVVRNVTLVFPSIAYQDVRATEGSLEKEIGGMSRADLREYLDRIAEMHASRPIRIDLGPEAGTMETSFGAIGIGVDINQTMADAMRVGRIGGSFQRAVKWFGSNFQSHRTQVHYRTQPDPDSPFFSELEDIIFAPPQDAQLLPRGEQNSFQFSPGKEGRIICAFDIGPRVLQSADVFASEILISDIPAYILPTRTFNDDIAEQIDFLNQATSNGLTVRSANLSHRFSAEEVRGWLSADYEVSGSTPSSCADLPSDPAVWGEGEANPTGTFSLAISLRDPQSFHALFEEVLKDDIIAGTSARTISWNGQELAMDVTPGSRCCAPFDADSILHALFSSQLGSQSSSQLGSTAAASSRATPAIQLEMRTDPEILPPNAATGDIKQTVSEFTTFHLPDTPERPQARVRNIQRFADLMKGVVIQPGETFSLNDHVGRRTIANGFFVSQMLTSGGLVGSVGGGVSQFATTFFNAAFFAGLDFEEYQMHTYYFDRYPYGREATISFGDIDLIVTNTTPYEILVWPTYTEDSITVTFFSTEWVDARQSDQVELQEARCVRVRTERTRVYPDGEVAIDRFTAFYRPQLRGICGFNPLIRPLKCADNEIGIDTNGNLWPDWCRPCPEGQVPDRTIERRQKCYAPEEVSAWAIDPDTASPAELLVSLPNAV